MFLSEERKSVVTPSNEVFSPGECLDRISQLIIPPLQAIRVAVCVFLLLPSCQGVKDHYRTLGLAKGASSKDIRKAFRKLALQYHPDKNPQEKTLDNFREVAEAYGVLGDKEKRRVYDNKKFPPRLGRGTRFNQRKFPFEDHFGDNFFREAEIKGRSGDVVFGAHGFKDDMFLATSSFVRMGRKGGGMKCKTISQKTGNMQSTFTQCS